MRRAVFIFAAVATLVSRAAAAELAAQPTVREGVSIRLPAGWTADAPAGTTEGGRRTPLTARAGTRDKDDTGDFQTVMSVSVELGNKVDAAAQQARLASDRMLSNYEAVEKPTAVKLAGAEGVMFGGTFMLGPLKLRSRQYMLAKGGKVYVVTFTSLASQWARYRPLLEASVGSMAVGPEK